MDTRVVIDDPYEPVDKEKLERVYVWARDFEPKHAVSVGSIYVSRAEMDMLLGDNGE